ncbi:MAG: TRAP transporter small permease [Rhodobacterales bacterium]|nr:TRAP transporter small permease [Rhodobacterales bacterium]
MQIQAEADRTGWRGAAFRFCNILAILCQTISALAIATMFTLVCIQVVYRYILNVPLGWTQELSVFSLVLSVMFGMAAAFWHGEHFHVSLLRDNLPPLPGNILRFVGRAATIVFLSIVMWQSYTLSLRAMRQISPTTGIPIGYIQWFLVAGSAAALIFVVMRTLLWRNVSAVAEYEVGEDGK